MTNRTAPVMRRVTMKPIVLLAIVLAAWVLPAAAQLPSNVEKIQSPACSTIGTPAAPEDALATGCYRPWPLTGKSPEEQEQLRAQFRRWYAIWQIAQVNSRGHYAARKLTDEDRGATATKGAPAPDTSGATSWSGSGSKDTESFSIGGEWRVVWNATPTSPRTAGALSITVHDAANGRVVSSLSSGDIATARQDSSVVRTPPGRYYLSISSALVNWQVRIAQ